jgi:predicted RNA polymerase sigma factor
MEPSDHLFRREAGRMVATLTRIFGVHNLDQLRMMFSCCHPRLPEEAQIALVLHILCGFSVGEIASAFVSSHAAIEKRITRAKKVLAGSKKLFDIAGDDDFSGRLPAVQRALYLLFNEGYHGASPESAVRAELCQEAMRLTGLLLDQPLAATPATYALAALMCLHAARSPARVDSAGQLTSLFDQDRSRWDSPLAAEGQRLLDLSATGTELSEYHIEAAIASIHAMAVRTEDTDWEKIVSLYHTLMAIRPSPVVALNRAIAIAQLEGSERGLEEIHAIVGSDRLAAYPFYFAALGELELRSGRHQAAHAHFQAALVIARNPMERQFLQRRAAACANFVPQPAR